MFNHIKLYLFSAALVAGITISVSGQDSLHTDIVVQGACGMCQDRIEQVALKDAKVFAAFWDVEDNILHLDHFTGLDADNLQKNIAATGHDTERYRGDDDAYYRLPACCLYRGDVRPQPEEEEVEVIESNENPVDPAVDSVHSHVFVDGICGMCQDRIEAVANNFKNVLSAFWDVEERILHLDHTSKLNIKSLQRALAREGHDTDLLKASGFAYNELHECCKYRDQDVINEHNPSNSTVDEVIDEDPADAYSIQGIILEMDDAGKELPIIGANIYWAGTTIGTVSDLDGYFKLDKSNGGKLIVSYVGYNNDTMSIDEQQFIEIVMSDATMMREVTITHKQKSTGVSFLSAGKLQKIGEKELLKAACCNLSESFETNPTVDVSVTDAVTGTRQIKMLGLAGPNIQITREAVPDIRGLSALYGLTFTPGTWIEGININTGTGSVVNGFESIAGQIDVSLKKPDRSERFYFNLYANEMSRIEANMNYAHRFNDKISTGILLHGSIIPTKHDNNDDGFLDHPISDQFVAMNRWKYYGNNGLVTQIGIKVTSLDNRSGQSSFDHDSDEGSESLWGARSELKKYEGWWKIGKVFPSKPYASMGLQVAASYFDQESYFGLRPYNADQTSFYSNLIYQSMITDTRHKFKTGLSFQWDKINEDVIQMNFERNESVPGAFFEYSYQPNDKISVVAGLRGDYHNEFGFFATPRLHLRYAPNETTVFRLSGGRGQRTASIFAENIGAFASSRQIFVQGNNSSTPYGLDVEVSWNTGFNFVKEFTIAQRSFLFQFDLYHTSFSNQIVADYDASPQELTFYNFDGQSTSNSLQTQIDYEVLKGWDVRLAYRLNDVQTTYSGETLQKPLTGKHRAFINTQYTTKNDWSFDFTLNWQGQKRIPNTISNPIEFQRDDYSPDYFLANAQISKSWNKVFDIYVGAMNLFNYRQDDPIISADDAFSNHFDASLIWGPVFGREIYAGIRYKLL